MSGADSPPPGLVEQAHRAAGEMMHLINVSYVQGYQEACAHITINLRMTAESIQNNYALDSQIRMSCMFVLDEIAKAIDLAALSVEIPPHPNGNG